MNKKFLQLVIVLCFSAFVYADNYEILCLNVPTIKINGKLCKKGDVFSDKSVIAWDKGKKQAIKARNTKTMEIVRFTAPEFNKKKATTVKDYLKEFFKLEDEELSTRNIDFLESLSCIFDDTFYLVDSIGIESPIPLDGTNTYNISYIKDHERVTKNLPTKDDHFYIVRSLFEPCDSTEEVVVSISLKVENIEEYVLTDSMRISILPMYLDK